MVRAVVVRAVVVRAAERHPCMSGPRVGTAWSPRSAASEAIALKPPLPGVRK